MAGLHGPRSHYPARWLHEEDAQQHPRGISMPKDCLGASGGFLTRRHGRLRTIKQGTGAPVEPTTGRFLWRERNKPTALPNSTSWDWAVHSINGFWPRASRISCRSCEVWAGECAARAHVGDRSQDPAVLSISIAEALTAIVVGEDAVSNASHVGRPETLFEVSPLLRMWMPPNSWLPSPFQEGARSVALVCS
jgi:hypothetical protein